MNDLLGRIRVLWEGLAPRERILVGTAGGALAFSILVAGPAFAEPRDVIFDIVEAASMAEEPLSA